MSQIGIQDPVEALIERAGAEGWPLTYTDIHAIRSPELGSLAMIWREKAGNRPAPAREEMDARSLKHVLRRITIIERVIDADRPVRVWAPYDHPKAQHLSGESLLLPLLGQDGAVSVLLTATFFFSRVDNNTDDGAPQA